MMDITESALYYFMICLLLLAGVVLVYLCYNGLTVNRLVNQLMRRESLLNLADYIELQPPPPYSTAVQSANTVNTANTANTIV